MTTVEVEWVNLLAEVFERLTAKHSSISYDFNGVTFEGDRVNTEGKYVPTGKVTISGKITITVG